jgi:hypothetical protein
MTRLPTDVRRRRARFSRLAAAAGALLILAVAPRAAFAWDDLGHMVITRIAWSQLTPATRARIIALLERAPADAGLAQLRPAAGAPDRDLMFAAYASTWPDLVRRDDPPARHAYNRPPWHYINWYWTATADGRIERVDSLPAGSANILAELARMSAVVRDSTAPAGDRAVALAWLLHLTGDIAQPLHASSRVSAGHPQGDKGGNTYLLDAPMSLHWYWDRVLSTRYPRFPAEEDDAYVARVAGDVLRDAPPDFTAARIAAGDFTLWARQSLDAAEHEVYCCDVRPGVAASPAYLAHAAAVSEPAIALAGYRLAALLEELFGQ